LQATWLVASPVDAPGARLEDPRMDYAIHENIKYGPLEVVDAGKLADGCGEKWWNQSLCKINDSVARVGVFEGVFHFHKHDNEDELFWVIEGKLFVDLEDRTFELGPRQAVVVPKGVVHRTRAPERAVVLMIEAATVKPTGD
jgi:mannose-6-phosphate isomerase-like protein (cupin superfamily)